MDAPGRIRSEPPLVVDELESEGALGVRELWLLARRSSRLRHRTPPGPARRDLEALKARCLRLALAREPDLFLVMIDPGMTHLRLIYHRADRTLLHVPVTTDLGNGAEPRACHDARG